MCKVFVECARPARAEGGRPRRGVARKHELVHVSRIYRNRSRGSFASSGGHWYDCLQREMRKVHPR